MRLKTGLIILLCSLLWSSGLAASGFNAFPNLRQHLDGELQEKLDHTLERLHLKRAAGRGELSLALIDITDEEHPRVAAINGDRMMYAASLPKIAILLGAFVEIERGILSLDQETRQSLTKMIRFSSNRDATMMLNKVGKERLLEILKSDRFRLYDPQQGGGLWVGKEYGKSPAYARDPIHNLSHGATALQAARFYYMLETGQLVNPQLTEVMKEMLGKPGIEHKFVKGLKKRPGTRIFRKSGSWRRWHADSALIENGRYKYILVALAENSRGGEWLSRLATSVNDLIVPTRIARAD